MARLCFVECFILSMLGALSVAVGMWMVVKWWTRGPRNPTTQGETKELQTDETDDPTYIACQLCQRIDETA